jgi:hypothetical protein
MSMSDFWIVTLYGFVGRYASNISNKYRLHFQSRNVLSTHTSTWRYNPKINIELRQNTVPTSGTPFLTYYRGET